MGAASATPATAIFCEISFHTSPLSARGRSAPRLPEMLPITITGGRGSASSWSCDEIHPYGVLLMALVPEPRSSLCVAFASRCPIRLASRAPYTPLQGTEELNRTGCTGVCTLGMKRMWPVLARASALRRAASASTASASASSSSSESFSPSESDSGAVPALGTRSWFTAMQKLRI
jgi:hypothetical protein